MRLCVEFHAPTSVVVPWDYPHHLHGMLSRAILAARPSLQELFHGEGFRAGGHRYRLLTASWLFPKRMQRLPEGLLMEPPVRWWIASPLHALMEALSVAFLAEPERRVGAAVLTVAAIRVEPLPTFSRPVVLRTISPIVVSTAELRPDGRRHRRFLPPDHPAFWRNLEENLRRKAQALFGAETAFQPIRFRLLGQPRSRLVKVQGTQVRCFELRFWAAGDATLLALGYEAGFGERNQQCFGMVAVESAQGASDLGQNEAEGTPPPTALP